ncbi:hypothetical protein ACET3Z_013368 [Daucus carota]
MGKDSSDPDDADALFVEIDPSGRYGRYKEVLGKGSFKKVYRAFDEWEGIEVAWNQVKVADLLKNSVDMERLYSEVHLLKTLKHKNIIKFYNSWVDAKSEHINFITEIFTSGTLRQYRQKHKHVNLRALKKWSKQILEGLSYLHSHDPPVIHRDLKCDNIFVNGNQGEVKIGDLGLAAILQARSAHSVIGTPEFMAPELYEEEYDQLIDIYAFGMCLLELVTFEYPYVECANAAQIYKKVTSGVRPASLVKVKDPEVRAFIEKCIAKVPDRLPARELLLDPFLHSDGAYESVGQSIRTNPHIAGKNSDNLDNGEKLKDPGLDSSRDFTVQGQRKDLNTVFLKLRIADSTGQIRNIHFPFDIEVDTSAAVASEMVEELDLTDQDASAITEMIDTEIRTYIPDWTAGELSSSIGNEVAMSDYCSTEGQIDSSPVTNLSSIPASIVLERLPSGRKYWSVSPRAGIESSPVKPGPRLLLNQEETNAEKPNEENIRSVVSSRHMDNSSANSAGKKGASVSSPGVFDYFPVRNLPSLPGSFLELPSGRKYWSVSPKASNGSSPVKPGPRFLSNQHMETSADSRTKGNNKSSVRSQHVDDSKDEALLEMQKGTVSSQNVADSSPMTYIFSPPGSVILEQLPAGKNHWSVSPKGKQGSFPVKPGPHFLSNQVMEIYTDKRAEENLKAFIASQHNSSDKALHEEQNPSILNGNSSDSKHKLSDSSLLGVPALHLGNGPDSVSGNGPIPGNFDSDDDNMVVKKLGSILVEHQRELNELKKKHELIVSDLLKELPPKVRDKFLKNLDMEAPHQNTDSGLNSSDSLLPIYSRRLQNLSTAVEGRKRNSEAENIVCRPISRDKFKTPKVDTKSDISGMGIAIILSDNGVGF